MAAADFSYRMVPSLRAYIDRIGAEEVNFRRFLVKDYSSDNKHYYRERVVIRIATDGTVSCSRKDYEPTKEEAEAIKTEFLTVDFPKSIMATYANFETLLNSGDIKGKAYEFWDVTRKGILMVQERREKDDGKFYLPWTFFSDGKWRMLEPDGALPFWKPKEKLKRLRIMIHEGAKTAAVVTEMLKNGDPHPWREELELFEHWGMVGGALAPHRADYAEIRAVKPREVIYSCDNDFAGRAALQEVSRCYGGSMKGVVYLDHWPPSWDMADPMPKQMFTKSGRYIGASLSGLMKPATFATEVFTAKKGRQVITMRKEFTEEWYHVVTPLVFVNKHWPNRVWNAVEFDNIVRPFSNVTETSRLLKEEDASKVVALKYIPSLPPGIYTVSDKQLVNTHVPTRIKAEKGDAKPFLDFMAHLIPDKGDRHEVLRWIATLIARPDVKMTYGLLLISTMQGVGKGTLAEKICAPLMGEDNVSYPSESSIGESQFNSWAARKRLAIAHEIYSGHSLKVYDKLKSLLTDKALSINEKYRGEYVIDNWIHVLACSNSMRAIRISSEDRRWLVPSVTEEKQPHAYWVGLNAWLTEDGGLGIIKWWASDWLKKKGHDAVLGGEDAPFTTHKQEMIEEGYSRGMEIVVAILDHLKETRIKNGEKLVIKDRDLVSLISHVIYDGRMNDKLEKPRTLRRLACSRGWHVGKTRVKLSGLQFVVISNDPETAELSAEDLSEVLKTAAPSPYKLVDVLSVYTAELAEKRTM